MGKKQKRKGDSFEREVAKAFACERVGNRGRKDSDHADIVHDEFYIQCRRRKSLLVENWMRETEEACSEKIPLVVARADRSESLVVLRLEDFLKLRSLPDPWYSLDELRKEKV